MNEILCRPSRNCGIAAGLKRSDQSSDLRGRDGRRGMVLHANPPTLGLAIMAVWAIVALAVVAAPDDRYKGGSDDGYDVCSSNEVVLPPPPPVGTVVLIL